MDVQQLYYTSYTNRETGKMGFQVRASSAGITPMLQTQIVRAIDYRIPPTQDPQALETHPTALRYLRLASGDVILLCSQSCGNDENGRPGNFFTHAIVLAPDLFTSVPPVFYWKSSFWQASATEEQATITALPVLAEFDEEPTIDSEDIWAFLDDEQRRTLLEPLLSAVVHAEETRRHIIIIDTANHVALWIAAISCLLPPAYRPFLTFSTYHHNPRQAPYLINGISPDTLLRITPELAQSYFILDTRAGITSEVPASPYAKVAAGAASSAAYETVLLPIFSDYTQLFPQPTSIDRHLDLLVLYAERQQSRSRAPLSPNEQQAFHLVLTMFEQDREYTPEILDELIVLERALRLTMREQPELATDHQRVIQLLKDTHFPLDAVLHRAIAHITESNRDEDTAQTEHELADLYYQLVLTLSLSERQPYREIMLPYTRNILHDEIRHDLYIAPPERRIAVIEQWVQHSKDRKDELELLLEAALTQWQSEGLTPQEWQYIARSILLNDAIYAPLPPPIERRLVLLASACISFDHLTREDQKFGQKYKQHPALPVETSIILDTHEAVHNGKMTEALVQRLQSYSAQLTLTHYEMMLQYTLPIFFKHNVTHSEQRNLIQALYPTHRQTQKEYAFWSIYFSTLITFLRQPDSAPQVVNMLDFWFMSTPHEFNAEYPVQQCLLTLASHDLCRSKTMCQERKMLATSAHNRPWYPAFTRTVSRVTTTQTTMGQTLINKIFQKHHGSHTDQKQQPVAHTEVPADTPIIDWDTELARLSEPETTHRAHTHLLKQITKEQAEQFWNHYWPWFSQCWQTQQAELIYMICTFWFDQAYKSEEIDRLYPQEFLLGLPWCLENIIKTRALHQTISAVTKKIIRQAENSWGPLLVALLGEIH